MMKKLFLMCAAFATQYFAPQLEVRGIGGDTFQVEYETDATIAEICAKISAETMIPLNLIRILSGTKALDLRSSDPFPGEVTSVGLVKLPSDCMVEFNQGKIIISLTKVEGEIKIKITSDKVNKWQIVKDPNKIPDKPDTIESRVYAGLQFARYSSPGAEPPKPAKDELCCNFVGPHLFKSLIPSLSTLYHEEGLGESSLCIDLRLYNDDRFRMYFPDTTILQLEKPLKFANWICFAIVYREWFVEVTNPQGLSDLKYHEFFTSYPELAEIFHYLFEGLKSSNYPEFDELRKGIHSRALDKFPDETQEVLELNPTPRTPKVDDVLPRWTAFFNRFNG